MHPLPPPRRGILDGAGEARNQSSSNLTPATAPRQGNALASGGRQASTSTATAITDPGTGPSTVTGDQPKKRRKHRGGKRKKNRRQSFAAVSETSEMPDVREDALIEGDEGISPETAQRRVFGGSRRNGHLSDNSLDSDELFDHRNQPSTRRRRDSRAGQGPYGTSYRSGMLELPRSSYRPDSGRNNSRPALRMESSGRASQHDSDGDDDANDETPLIGSAIQKSPVEAYGMFNTRTQQRKGSNSTSSSRKRRRGPTRSESFPGFTQEYDVNNPPSMPPSPQMQGRNGVDDVMVPGGDFLTRSPDSRRNLAGSPHDALIDIDGDGAAGLIGNSAPPSPRLRPDDYQRRRTINLPPTDDVCLPVDTMSELADDDFEPDRKHFTGGSRRRNRRRGFPQLWVLEDWSREEKEDRMGGIRAKKISEPVLVEGRLRPSKGQWHQRPEDLPYRYTYFNEEFESTIHAQTISELVQPGGSFRELFIPEPPELTDSSSDEEDKQPESKKDDENDSNLLSPNSANRNGEEHTGIGSRLSSMLTGTKVSSHETSGKGSNQISPNHSRSDSPTRSKQASGAVTPVGEEPQPESPKQKKYGKRPSFWLDVMCPTTQEMQVLCKTFGIHALTSEDIMMQEQREKVELFRNYYFINYRTFEQDTNSEEYMEPLNIYIIVFQTGVLSFHFSQIPHPANVRRRIRQLVDYMELSPDWIAYGIIDDITDVYQPLIHAIESEVDDIDEQVLKLFQDTEELTKEPMSMINEKESDSSSVNSNGPSGIDLLRRVGECRKKVMSLYRLLGNKADVIKGFAKRCNEQWEVAPKSEIGLYLGDIQDHILTMTSNLGHYETLLSRAHSNYLAQINIRMNERQEQTADVLGKLTVVGTIVLPMNIICGMWGMNVKVPGQEVDSLTWFWSITAGLIAFAVICFFWAKKVYGIV